MTKRIIFTGGPTSGKSTMIGILKEMNYNTFPEVARQVIEERKRFGSSKDEWAIRQDIIFNRCLNNESRAEGEYTFYDRSAIDTFVYLEFHGLEVPKYMKEIDFSNRYDKILMLDRLPYEDDGLRVEGDDETAKRVHDLTVKAYTSRDLEFVSIPVAETPEKRLELILEEVFR